MRSAIVARVCVRNPMEVADDLGHRFWRFRMPDHGSEALQSRCMDNQCYSWAARLLLEAKRP